MLEDESSVSFFRTMKRMLLRCWLFGFLLLLVWVGAFAFARDLIHRLHGEMFGLSAHELDLIFYCGIGLTKIIVLALFLMPWAALCMILPKAK